ncbi:peptidase C14 [Conidiobolus coronatus NRRL 28638]|uniref:Peptidase C14 n=1 Tax=Conidiobolus coronatus (strain ATCC 28846 / CBS 209.66 / NRRL 28638) TaxID=796925 RepID=A0A137PAU6_CONC2|nr:peptidase C14 [Conidiobolus coronatus NRRL 28638]|eukprot:KXN72140.1 peptidase C14 [Conidiobolus coronatus NRRL 28638]
MESLSKDQPIPEGFEAGQQIQVSNFSGQKKALLIGINYFKTKAELRGCINDVQNVKNFLIKAYGFKQDDMVILTDDQQDSKFIPTRQNMIKAMHWLVSDVKANDSCFFHYSGHGSQEQDKDGDDVDGFDETICPVDYERAGMINDDEMNSIMVKPLPQGCRLTAIFDCCHSGTALDLPYVYNDEGKLKSYNPAKVAVSTLASVGMSYMSGNLIGAAMGLKDGIEKIVNGKNATEKNKREKASLADVVMFSGGCKDDQTSADTQEQGVGSTGAMSYALIKSLKSEPYDLTYIQLLNSVRQILRGKYQQLPQLSSGRPMDMNHKFMM